MNRIIPIMPCQSIKEQAAFYEALGFTTLQRSTRPNPYLSMGYGELEIHFYGSKKTIPAENATMCYVKVDNVEWIYKEFTSNLKKNTGKVPRSGYPRISKLKDLTDDQRFIVTDIAVIRYISEHPMTNGRTRCFGDRSKVLNMPSILKSFMI